MEPNRKPIRLAFAKLVLKLNVTEMKAPSTWYLEPLNSPTFLPSVLKKKSKTSRQSFRTLREGSATIAC